MRATPSTTTIVFCSSSSCGCVCHVELAGHLEELGEEPRHGNLVRRPVHDRLADGAQRLREDCRVLMRRHIARIEMHLRDARHSRGG